jgi:hypothetical protein
MIIYTAASRQIRPYQNSAVDAEKPRIAQEFIPQKPLSQDILAFKGKKQGGLCSEPSQKS